MANELFDFIVIGGGPAGCSAALTLAKHNFKVCLIERGDFPGSKNVMGGILYSQPTSQIIPEFYKEAPLERKIIEQNIWWLGDQDAMKFAYRNPEFNKEPYNSFSVLRAKFDNWFAGKVDEAGAYVISKTSVTDFITDGDKFTGVKTDRPDGDLKAKAIILAEGANSMLTVKTGLAKPIESKNVALAVKQILFLQEEKINERFNISSGEGSATEIIGDITEGMTGLAFLYTNKNTISIGVG
jgi:electron transfer flavoprotein-quinone oxidoreductase